MSDLAINKHIFRQYDIRGLIGDDLNSEVVEAVGKSFGSRLVENGGKKVVIGHDIRETGPEFAEALGKGLASCGLEVINVGQVATPVLYFGIFHFDTDGGVMITGSHNPVTYNGLKICEGKWPLFGDQITGLYERIKAEDFVSGEGSIRNEEILPAYAAQLKERFDSDLDAKVVVDAGNGTAGFIIPEILRALGCEVEELYCEPDGTFPNHLPDPEDPANVQDLIKKVKETGADLGLGFDGDSDRVGIITSEGEQISSDRLVLVFAKHYLASNPGGKIIYDVKCSEILDDEIKKAGGVPIMWQTGHSLIKKKMREEDALVAGELSGHIMIYKDYYGFDDAFFAALLTLQIRKNQGREVHEIFAEMPKTFTTHEIKVPCPDDKKFGVVDAILKTTKEAGHEVIDIDGARIQYEDGWALIRCSNTTPCLTLRFESRTQEGLGKVILRIEELFQGYDDCDTTLLQKISQDVATASH